ncbi:unnamed protein product [Closterium sp. Naga37s-1]|nr:unnamed protein product [Closterium sp. Naga37s-1]
MPARVSGIARTTNVTASLFVTTFLCSSSSYLWWNRTGDDFCDCPNPRSGLEPEFFVGTECEVPAVMCADTDTFFCGNGAQCVEIVQGEQYSCEGCPLGYGGQHCESRGVQCGDSGLLCFNGGSCGHSGTSCVCPRQWSGNANCTLSLFDAYHQQASPYGSQAEEEDQSWYVPVLGAFGALVMLSILGVWIYICYAHQAMSSFSHIADQEESRALQDDVEERELVELDSHGEEDEGSYYDNGGGSKGRHDEDGGNSMEESEEEDIEEGERVPLR